MKLTARDDNCSGCRVCQGVCALENFREMNPAKSALRIEGLFPAPGKYKVHVCNQCGLCSEACPVQAIQLKDDAYVIQQEECTGCLACVDACPQNVMFAHKGTSVPIKCNLCGECAKLCPRDALIVED